MGTMTLLRHKGKARTVVSPDERRLPANGGSGRGWRIVWRIPLEAGACDCRHDETKFKAQAAQMNRYSETLIMAGLMDQGAQRMVAQRSPERRAYAGQVPTVAVQNGLTGQQLRLVDILRANGFALTMPVDAFWRARRNRG